MARDSKIDHSLVRRREARYAEEFKERGSYQSQKRRDDMGQRRHIAARRAWTDNSRFRFDDDDDYYA